MKRLVEMGLPVEGSSKIEEPASLAPDVSTLSVADEEFHLGSNETPFAVAIRHNSSTLTETLPTLGADPNSLSLTSGLFAAPFPLTVLGHVITPNARYCRARLNRLLRKARHLFRRRTITQSPGAAHMGHGPARNQETD